MFIICQKGSWCRTECRGMGSAIFDKRYAMVVTAVDNLIAALKNAKPTHNWVNPLAS